MLRSFLLYLSRARWMMNLMMNLGVARRVARRFVAGETEDDAITTIRKLNEQGITATVDILGESVTVPAEAEQSAQAYLKLIERIPREKLEAWVSLKLTSLGLDIDPVLCRENVRCVLQAAVKNGVRVTIDMEDHTYTERTLDELYALIREDGFENVQAVIQAYLYRSDDDIAKLAADGVEVRLCKGAYKEPSSVAYPRKSDVDAAYVRLMKVLLDAAGESRGYPMLATHDEKIIDQARRYTTEKSIPRDRFEFQMLYGIRTDLQQALIRDGYRMRVYVPFGTRWYPYLMRRLAERPANLWFFASNLLRS